MATTTGRVTTSLPADLTSFVGRRAEVAEVKRLLASHRLVTVMGVGGVGKTRLALRVAREVRRSVTDGVAWVELADLRDPALLPQTVEDALSVSDKTGREPLSNLANHLRDRNALIALDNAEHVLERCAALVAHLLRAAPNLRFLVTSRQALGVPGERLLSLAPLLVPDEKQAAEDGAAIAYPSIVLFAERAAASIPGFVVDADNQEAVAAICRAVEGIPLAIELATVRLRVLSVGELAHRLDDRLEVLGRGSLQLPSRHQTLQATIDWSHELCTQTEQLLWARASVFAGGFGIQAAEACCADAKLPSAAVLDAVAGLVEKSILVRSERDGRVRFRLLEPLREYGSAQLLAMGEERKAHDRHLAWCANLVNEACVQWFGPAQESWCVTLRLESANLRAAAEHCLRQRDKVDVALRLVGDPWFVWVALFLDEGRYWLEKALALASDETPARAKALATAGYVTSLQGDFAAAESFLAASRDAAGMLEDTATQAYATHVLGVNALFADPAKAVSLLREGLSLYGQVPELSDDYVVALRVQLGLALLFEAELDAAEEQFVNCRDLCTASGERWLLSYALYGLAFVSYARGDLESGFSLARQALRIKRFFGDTLGLAVTLDLLAWMTAGRDGAEQAAVLLGAAERVWATFGVCLFGSEHWLAERQKAVEQVQASLGERKYRAAHDAGLALDQAAAVAFALEERKGAQPAPRAQDVALTPREREIADLVAEGLSNRDISRRLVIAQRTAESHVENILTKFGFRSRAQIAAWVVERRAASGVR